MSIEFNQDAVEQTARQLAERVLFAGVFFLDHHRRRVSRPFNTHGASKAGEYPALRSGMGRDGAVMDCHSIEEVLANNLTLRIGQQLNSWYMTHLRNKRGRLGILDTAKDLEPQLGQILTGNRR